MSRLSVRAAWLLPFALCLLEAGIHVLVRVSVPDPEDWWRAAALVRSERHGHDLITTAPAWADPQLRLVLGDVIDLAMAGRTDASAYDRIWSLSTRGARPPEAPARPPDFAQSFGRVTVERWDVPRTGRYDFVQHVRQARVTLGGVPCSWLRGGRARGGGLGRGVLLPEERFVCDRQRLSLWVAPVVMEDLNLAPRHCVWQHPEGRTPLSVEFSDVPLSERIVFHGGLYYEDERMRQGGPVSVQLYVNDRSAGRLIHRDGDGWKGVVVPTKGLEGTRGRFRVEVTAPHPQKRSFCWSASVRGGAQ